MSSASDFGDYKKQSFGEKLKAMFCCGEYDDDEYESSRRPALHISSPTNFRREGIQISGLSDTEAQEIRDRQLHTANKIWKTLQPLHSSPSGTFAERPAQPGIPSFEQFTQPRAAPTPGSTPVLPAPDRFSQQQQYIGTQNGGGTSRLDRIKTHSRKISDSLQNSFTSSSSSSSSKPLPLSTNDYSSRTYRAVSRESDSAVEMRALMAFAESGKGGSSGTVSNVGGGAGPRMSEESLSQSETGESRKDEKERFDSGIGRGLMEF